MSETAFNIDAQDSTPNAWDYITAETRWDGYVRKLANEMFSERHTWSEDTDYDAVESFLEHHGDEITVLEKWETYDSDDDDGYVTFVHYFKEGAGEMRMFDPRSGEDIDESDTWLEHALKYSGDKSSYCFATRDEAFDHIGFSDPSDSGYGEGGYGNDVTLTVEGDSVESDDVTVVEDITFETMTPEDSGKSALNTLYGDTTYEFSATFDSDGSTMGPTASDVLRDTADTVEDKHGDYGHAIEKVAAIKGVLAVEGEPKIVELDDGREAVVMGDHAEETFQQKRMGGIITRLLDKVCRGYTLQFQNREDNVGEKLRETWSDAAGYCGHAATGGDEDGA